MNKVWVIILQYHCCFFNLQEAKILACHLWLWMILIMILMTFFSIFVNCHHKFPSLCKSFTSFVSKNICKRYEGGSSGGGVSKGIIRFFDTSGTISALTGLILGISSLFIDRFDFTFEPRGKIKEVSYKVYCKIFYSDVISEVCLNHYYILFNSNLIFYTGHWQVCGIWILSFFWSSSHSTKHRRQIRPRVYMRKCLYSDCSSRRSRIVRELDSRWKYTSKYYEKGNINLWL